VLLTIVSRWSGSRDFAGPQAARTLAIGAEIRFARGFRARGFSPEALSTRRPTVRRFFLLTVAAGLLAAAPARAANPVVVMETSMGTIKIELYADKAPLTVKNFLRYTDDKHYDGLIFHRVIANFMVQGGGFEPGLKEKKTHEPVKNESANGLQNKRYTLAMARTPDPDSATSQFFINAKDNDFLDKEKARDGVGYCVFGKVIEGQDVVDKIKGVKTTTKFQTVTIDGETKRIPHQDVPVDDVIIKSVRRADR
jgi:cyclophilin family peptidyl-prolyl cis-trans isomerase